MKITSINNTDRSRYGLKVQPVEKVDIKKIKEYPHEESQEKVWKEYAKQVGEQALKGTNSKEQIKDKPTTPGFDSGHKLDRYV